MAEPPRRTLGEAAIETLAAGLQAANRAFAAAHRGEPGARQPVHTVYGGAQLFRADTAVRLGAAARAAMDRYAPDPGALAAAVGWQPGDPVAAAVHERTAAKLAREPVEDFRIDFEDGYGVRPDDEEDSHAVGAAHEVARALSEGTLPPFVGIRVKPLNEELRGRAVRTLDLFLTALVEKTSGRLPDHFVVTLPKITVPEQMSFAAAVLGHLERGLGLGGGTLRVELMVETPQVVLGSDGRSPLPALVAASGGRLTAAHFGTYDYTAGLGITASEQRMRHAACDFAKHVMQVVLAGTGVWLSDGSTTVLPVPPHRRSDGGRLDPEQERRNREAVHRAWRLHHDDILHSLAGGFYQGWDLHPAQLVSRYAAVYGFFLRGIDAAAERLSNFVGKAAQATLVGDVFDDAATGQGLLNYFLRAVNCGAVSEREVIERTGLTHDELLGRSFVAILKRRR
jgi:citrate lyase beta subunit